MHALTLRLEQEQWVRLAVHCVQTGQTVSEFIRDAIDAKLAKAAA